MLAAKPASSRVVYNTSLTARRNRPPPAAVDRGRQGTYADLGAKRTIHWFVPRAHRRHSSQVRKSRMGCRRQGRLRLVQR
jgi:hypothetical protein